MAIVPIIRPDVGSAAAGRLQRPGGRPQPPPHRVLPSPPTVFSPYNPALWGLRRPRWVWRLTAGRWPRTRPPFEAVFGSGLRFWGRGVSARPGRRFGRPGDRRLGRSSDQGRGERQCFYRGQAHRPRENAPRRGRGTSNRVGASRTGRSLTVPPSPAPACEGSHAFAPRPFVVTTPGRSAGYPATSSVPGGFVPVSATSSPAGRGVAHVCQSGAVRKSGSLGEPPSGWFPGYPPRAGLRRDRRQQLFSHKAPDRH